MVKFFLVLIIDKMITYLLSFILFFKIYDQAAKDDIGTVRIQRPHKGPFYVSPKTIDQLIINLGKWARLLICMNKYMVFVFLFPFEVEFKENKFCRWYKYASVGLTAFGVYLIAKHAIEYIMERRRRSELQRK